MKQVLKLIAWGTILGLFSMMSCGGSDGGGGTDPQPTSVTLTTTSATLNANPITPTPNYSLTLNFDAGGQPNGYSVAGTADKQPTVGSSGTFSVSVSQVTFTSEGVSRQVAITSGTLNKEVVSVSLQWDLTKVDDGVSAAEQGAYLYTLSK